MSLPAPAPGFVPAQRPAQPEPPAAKGTPSWLISLLLVLSSTALLVLIDSTLWHWFVLPTSLCGVVLGAEVVDWARGRLGALEPRALVALFGLHLVYVVPMLHVLWDFWPEFVAPAEDWRGSLGVLAWVNLAGLVLYRVVVAVRIPSREPRFEIDRGRLATLAPWAVGVSLLGALVVLMQSGGPMGYLSAVSDPNNRTAFDGKGWLLLIGEAWPLLTATALIVLKRAWLREHRGAALGLLVVFTVVQLGIGGLYGARSNTVWPLLIVLGMLNLLVAPVRRVSLVTGVIVMTLFVWLYGFYKAVGLDVLDLRTGQASVASLSEETGRSIERVVLEDFGRAGIQAVVVDRVISGVAGPPVYGQTYAGALDTVVLPGPLETGLQNKMDAGLRAQYGNYGAGAGIVPSRIFGLAGEGIINFGLVGAPLMFVVLGLWVRFSTRVYRLAVHGSLAAALVAPGLGVSCVLLMGSDLDNVLWFVIKHMGPLLCLLWVSRVALRRSARRAGQGTVPTGNAARVTEAVGGRHV